MRYGTAASVRSPQRNEPTPAYSSTSFKRRLLCGRPILSVPISWQATCAEWSVRWKDLRRSSNVRDVRGAGGYGGGRMGLPVGRGGLGGGVGLLVILVVLFLFGGPDAILQLFSGGVGAPSSDQGQPLTANDETS